MLALFTYDICTTHKSNLNSVLNAVKLMKKIELHNECVHFLIECEDEHVLEKKK